MGSTWTAVPGAPSGELWTVWANGSGDLWVGGTTGVHRFDGTTWSEVSDVVATSVASIWGSSATDVWVLDDPSRGFMGSIAMMPDPTAWHWDGSSWSAHVFEANRGCPSCTGYVRGERLHTLIGFGPNDVWALGDWYCYETECPEWRATALHWDGSSWKPQAWGLVVPWHAIVAASGTSSNDLWVVGSRGTTSHWNGSAWSSPAANAVWGASARDVWSVGDDVRHWDGSAWSLVAAPTMKGLRGVWGSSASDVWAVGPSGGMHWNGTAWSVATGLSGNAVWGTSANDAWAVGDAGTILHWDGKTWSSSTSGTTNALRTIWGSSAGELFVGGDGGTFLRGDGTAWTVSAVACISVHGIWGASASDVWLVGYQCLLHWNGTAISSYGIGTYETSFGAVWGTSANDVWFVGDGRGSFGHWDGTSWSFYWAGTFRSLTSIWGSSTGDIWTVGEGDVLHRLM
jgi:hypothetical protein